MNKPKTKGNLRVAEDADLEGMRQEVIKQELSARSWKAYYEKMYFSLESEKLEPLYKEYQERLSKRMEEEKKKSEEFIKRLQEEIAKEQASKGEVPAEPVLEKEEA